MYFTSTTNKRPSLVVVLDVDVLGTWGGFVAKASRNRASAILKQ